MLPHLAGTGGGSKNRLEPQARPITTTAMRIQAFVQSGVVFAAMIRTACGGRDWPSEQAALQRQLTEARTALEAANTHLTELEEQNTSMRQLLEAQGRDMSDLAGSRTHLQQELDAAHAREQQQTARLNALRNMASQFRDMIRAGQLRVRIVRGSMVVELPENVLFDSGSAQL